MDVTLISEQSKKGVTVSQLKKAGKSTPNQNKISSNRKKVESESNSSDYENESTSEEFSGENLPKENGKAKTSQIYPSHPGTSSSFAEVKVKSKQPKKAVEKNLSEDESKEDVDVEKMLQLCTESAFPKKSLW